MTSRVLTTSDLREPNVVQWASVETLNSHDRRWPNAKKRYRSTVSPIHATSTPSTDDAYAPPRSRPRTSHEATIAIASFRHSQRSKQFVTAGRSTYGRFQQPLDHRTALFPHGHFATRRASVNVEAMHCMLCHRVKSVEELCSDKR